MAPVIDLYHSVVLRTEPDEDGKLHPVCSEDVTVDPQSWGKALRDWPEHPKRCDECYREVGAEAEEQIRQVGEADWGFA